MKPNITQLIPWFPLKRLIERFYPFNFQEIRENQSIIDFDILSFNRRVHWSIDIIDEFAHLFNWAGISSNPAIPWKESEIAKYGNYFDWTKAANNESFPWTKYLFFKYKDFIDWAYMDDLPVKLVIDDITYLNKEQRGYMAEFKNVDWSAWLIERFKDDLDWELLPRNPSIPYSEYFFTAYKDRIYFIDLVTNPWLLRDENLSLLDKIAYVDFNNVSQWKQDWTLDFIEKNKELLNWDLLSSNKYLPWSEELLEKYSDRWNWFEMSGHRNFPWSWQIIEMHEHEWNWQDRSDPYISMFRTMSSNPSLPWSRAFVERFGHYLGFGSTEQINDDEYQLLFGISSNRKIDWDLEFLLKYKERWDLESLSNNEAVYNLIKDWENEGISLEILKYLIADGKP